MKSAEKTTKPTVKELFRMLAKSAEMPEVEPAPANLKGQVRRRSRFMWAMSELLHLHREFSRLDVQLVEEQIRKHSRFVRKALNIKDVAMRSREGME